MTKTWHHECRELGRGLTLGVGAPCMHCKTNCALESANAKANALKNAGQMAIDNCEEQRRAIDLLLLESIEETKRERARAEAAEAKLKAASEQACRGHMREGCNYLSGCNVICNKCGHVHEAIATFPVPPVDVQQINAELDAMNANYQALLPLYKGAQRSIAELERKLAEQQAVIDWFNSLVAESSGVTGWHLNGTVAEWGEFAIPNTGEKELNTLRAKAREEGRKEAVLPLAKAYAWSQSLYKGATRCKSSGDEGDAATLNDIANWILAGAPTPGEK